MTSLWYWSGYILREALLQSSGSEYKFLNMFKFIKVVSDTVSDMINAVYCDKPLIESIWFQVNLHLIMVTGKTADFVFPNIVSAGEVAEHVYNNWPEGKQNRWECLYIFYLFFVVNIEDVPIILVFQSRNKINIKLCFTYL